MRRYIALVCITLLFQFSFAQSNGIINNTESPNVKLKSLNIGDCQWTQGFWADKYEVCEHTMMPYMGEILKGDIGHAYSNFKIAAGLAEGEYKGTNWHDGDFYKWMEASVYIYANNKDQDILDDLDEIIEVIGKAMDEDGYLSTAMKLKEIAPYSRIANHELYNSGHLLTSACIHHRVTGKSNFLELAIKHADFLYATFQPRPKKLARFGTNPSQIMGLVELYRTTKDAKYLELAEVFVDMRGTNKEDGLEATSTYAGPDSNQDGVAIRKEKEAVGHAVMAMYLYCGVADIYSETGEEALLKTLNRLWKSVDKKMYLTGAVGQTHHGASIRRHLMHEGFMSDYRMPNATAYNETCANIGNAMFNWRMLGIDGKSKHADIMEQVLYNSALSGISIEGKDYFYTNPLRRTGDQHLSKTDYKTRASYIPCFCCPPNLVRTIAKVSGWAYSKTDNGISVNLYGGNKLSTQLLGGSKLELEQVTQYPWDGDVKITIQKCKKEAFDILVRIPDWAAGAKVMVNNKEAGAKAVPGAFTVLKRKWKKGDVVRVNLPMDIHLMEGNPRIEEVRNQAAIKRGPVVYCVETPDLPENTSILDVYLPVMSELKASYRKDFLGGITSISGDVKLRKDNNKNTYYKMGDMKWETVKTTFVPYYTWSNRGESEMTVWLPLVLE